MSPSIPFNSPESYPCLFLGMSASFSMYVPLFHLPSCPLVSLSFVCLSVPRHSPCFLLLPLHVPFSSPLLPFHVPLHVLACPFISFPHFPAFSLRSLVFVQEKKERNKTWCFHVFSKKDVTKHRVFQIFGKGRQKTANQQRTGRGIRAWDPCVATRSPKTYF